MLLQISGEAMERLAGVAVVTAEETDTEKQPWPVTNPHSAARVEWLDVAQAAALAQQHGLDYQARWFYENHRRLPFAKKFSPRKLRFNRAGELEWIRTLG